VGRRETLEKTELPYNGSPVLRFRGRVFSILQLSKGEEAALPPVSCDSTVDRNTWRMLRSPMETSVSFGVGLRPYGSNKGKEQKAGLMFHWARGMIRPPHMSR
jgi:hypothetical protein